jgi:hypothetical protein
MPISLTTLEGVETGTYTVVTVKDNLYVTYLVNLDMKTSELIAASADFVHRVDNDVSIYKANVEEPFSYFASRNNIGFIRLGGKIVSIEDYH